MRLLNACAANDSYTDFRKAGNDRHRHIKKNIKELNILQPYEYIA